MKFGYSYTIILSNDTQLKGENMEKLTAEQQGLWTYSMLQKRKERIKRAEKRGDMEARQVIIESSIKAKNRHYRSSRR